MGDAAPAFVLPSHDLFLARALCLLSMISVRILSTFQVSDLRIDALNCFHHFVPFDNCITFSLLHIWNHITSL